MIHMDENGAVKFPADKAWQVLENAEKMLDEEAVLLEKLRHAKSAEDVRKANGFYGPAPTKK
jgi:regulator of RNase E activity RraA